MSERKNLNEKYDELMKMFKNNPEARSFVNRLVKDKEKKEEETKKSDKYFWMSIIAMCITPFPVVSAALIFKPNMIPCTFALGFMIGIIMCMWVKCATHDDKAHSVFSHYSISEIEMFNAALKNDSVSKTQVPILKSGKDFFVKTDEKEYEKVTFFVSDEDQKAVTEKKYLCLKVEIDAALKIFIDNIYLEEEREFAAL